MYQISEKRFTPDEIKAKNKVWSVLCKFFFQNYISENATVLDVGAGYCEFINNIRCSKKIACDINNSLSQHAHADVQFISCSTTNLTGVSDASVDVVFMSNVLEHLNSREDVCQTVREARRVLKQGGKFISLHPNIRFAKEAFWDFFDHQIPLTDQSLREVITSSGLSISKIIPCFLPYTSKSALPQNTFFVRVYLALPFLWKIFGGQSFIVATKN